MRCKEAETSPGSRSWLLAWLVLESSFLAPSLVLLSRLTGVAAKVETEWKNKKNHQGTNTDFFFSILFFFKCSL